MRQSIGVTLLIMLFLASPLLSCEAVSRIVQREFRDAARNGLLESIRLGLVESRKAEAWYIEFSSWMEGSHRE